LSDKSVELVQHGRTKLVRNLEAHIFYIQSPQTKYLSYHLDEFYSTQQRLNKIGDMGHFKIWTSRIDRLDQITNYERSYMPCGMRFCQ
jgi:hypothetical protein